jgi:hypothetical protein
MSLLSDKQTRQRLTLAAVIPLFLWLDSWVDARLWTLVSLLSCGTLYCSRYRGDATAAWKPIVFWITFAWLYRAVNVGISYDPGDLVSDLYTLTSIPVIDRYFPGPLGNPFVYASLHVVIPVLGLITLISGEVGMCRFFALVALTVSIIGSCHQFGIGNQMMVTTFWAAAYLVWLERHAFSEPQRKAVVGQLIASFIFFGAFLGKLTPEYWSSSVTAKLGQTPLLPSDVLTQGRMAIAVEGVASLTFLLRPDLAGGIGIFVVAGMLASVSPSVIDATGPVVGICMASFFLTPPEQGSTSR